MCSLNVEELEPRWLLNACTFSPRSPPGQPPARGTWTAQVALRAPSDHSGGCADAAGRGGPAEAGTQGNVSLTPGPQSLDGRGPGALSQPAPAVNTPQGGAALPGAGPESAGNAENDEGTGGTPPPEPADGSRGDGNTGGSGTGDPRGGASASTHSPSREPRRRCGPPRRAAGRSCLPAPARGHSGERRNGSRPGGGRGVPDPRRVRWSRTGSRSGAGRLGRRSPCQPC
jgi:hypothetical protein